MSVIQVAFLAFMRNPVLHWKSMNAQKKIPTYATRFGLSNATSIGSGFFLRVTQ